MTTVRTTNLYGHEFIVGPYRRVCVLCTLTQYRRRGKVSVPRKHTGPFPRPMFPCPKARR
jgi:hypothetical protein